MNPHVIFTSAPEFETAALGEVRIAINSEPGQSAIRAKASGLAIPRPLPGQFAVTLRLAPGVILVDPPGGFPDLSRRFRERPPLFVRHIQPVDSELTITGSPSDLERLEAAALRLAPRLLSGEPFSVQTRLTATLATGPSPDPSPYGRYEINQRLAAALADAAGAPLDVRAPAQVLSVLISPSAAYLGLSRAEQNLSEWAGGAIRFAREPEQISRAEFKLLEALRVFHRSFPQAGAALDLGASPGGWTRLLRQAGLVVDAVDPGDLDPRVAGDPGVRHLRMTAQEFRCPREEYAVIANDMRMDARDSARLMLDFAPCLDTKGLAVMTLKLPHRAAEAVARQSIELLRSRYRLLGARQLYHNRSEITVVLLSQHE